MAPMTEPVAIVGMGAVFPGAGDASAFWANIRGGVDAVTEVPSHRWDQGVYYSPGDQGAVDRFYCRRGGFVDEFATFDPTRFGIMPAAVDATEPDQLLALRAAAEAIADAGGEDGLPDRSRIGVVIGRGGYMTPGVARLDQRVHTAHQLTTILRDLVPGLAEDRLDAVRAAFQDTLGGPEPSIGLVPNFAASRLANRFDLRGPAYTVDAACASSLLAVDHAVRDLTTGRCDAVLAGGVHHCHHTTLWSVFTQLRALSPTERIRPFDRDADGTLLSEGTGIVLLKRLSDALAAGDRVYAVIRGVGVSSDGRATSMMNPLSEGQVPALEQAWRAAGVDPASPDAVGLIEAHGTATPAGDTAELDTMRRVFGAAGTPIGLGTVKSMIGHTMPAAGVAGLIKAAFALHHATLPPTLNVEEPHPDLAGTRFTPVTETAPWDRPAGGPRRAAVNAFGFGGINAHVVLEEAPGTMAAALPVQAVRPPAEPVLRLAGSGPEELVRVLEAEDADLIARAGEEPGDGPCRLAIVGPDARRLALARKIIARGRPWRGRSDVWFTPKPLLTGPEQVAFLFPGFEPDFTPKIEGIAEHFGLPDPALSGGEEVVEHALDVIAVSRLHAAAAGELGIVPGVLAGHSLGEWTAMIVAGVYPTIDEFIASMRPGMVEVPDVVYAALGASADRVTAELDGSGDVVVTHDNCPHQSVICGPSEAVGAVVERMRGQGVITQTLPFRTGFHSPMYAPHLEAARTTLRRLDVGPPSVPLWSATSLASFPTDPDDVRDLVLRHLIEPVRFRQLTERLYDTGVRAFVQIGPGSLTGFAEDTLRDREFLAIATAVPKRDGLSQLRRVAAALWADGLSPDFSKLPGAHAAKTAAPARRGTPVKLRLGDPMVRLKDVEGLTLAPAGEGSLQVVAGDRTGSPVAAALTAALADATAVARTVTEAWRAAPAGTPGRTPASRPSGTASPAGTNGHAGANGHASGTTGGPAPAPANGASAPGEPADLKKRSLARVFSLETMPDIADHCVFPQPEDWPDISDNFPVVPLTTMLEVMADEAVDLVPGTVVTGISQVRAARWLEVAPPTTTPVHAVRSDGPDGEPRVKVQIEGYASGIVHLSRDGHPPAPEPSRVPLRNPRPAPVGPRELYDDNWMFHGPKFAGVTGMGSLADDGMTGTLTNLPAKGALLDSAGQIIGHWMQVSLTVDQTVLPTGITAVRFYGPKPQVGARLECTAWIRELTDTEMRADAELRDEHGRVWCVIEGWTTRRFATDDRIWSVKLHAENETLSEPRPEGWSVVRELWPDTGTRELMMRRYLNAAERVRYEQLTLNTRRAWLLGRIAVKDAVRRRLWELGAGPIFPAEITVDNDERGRPRVSGAFRAPYVSLAHCAGAGRRPGIAVAMAGPEPVGIDLEAVTERAPEAEEIAFADIERKLLDGLAGEERALWFTRLWTAKEAVAKALGTGFGGRPRAFTVEVSGSASDPDPTLVVTAPDGSTHRVATKMINHDATVYAVAWTYGKDC
jgi:acyl transferase domain-containing protein/phosphopantetheinyl transferase